MVLVDVESVIGSGPVILLYGVVLMAMTPWARNRDVFRIGLANVLISLLFVALVNALSWSPGQAERPFAVMGAAYLLVLLGLTILAHRRAPRMDASRCPNCGYLLIGLPEPRCPECGTGFDPAVVQAAIEDEQDWAAFGGK
jgi:hypothetical protein